MKKKIKWFFEKFPWAPFTMSLLLILFSILFKAHDMLAVGYLGLIGTLLVFIRIIFIWRK